jgi:phosphoribosylformimino-5-aminoimidazole carboxamide ribotide isomerase
MQAIPVFDIKRGSLVHAVGGSRHDYLPLRTRLIPDPDPMRGSEILVRLGFRRLYIADLDAITREGDNVALIRDLAERFPLEIWLDAGLTGEEEPPLLNVPNLTWVIGSETFVSIEMLAKWTRIYPPGKLIFSLDIRAGQVIAADSSIADANILETVLKVVDQGIEDIIVLDLKAVGTQSGLGIDRIVELQRRTPKARFFPGGGLSANDLTQLKKFQVAGALTATALYSGHIAAAPEL